MRRILITNDDGIDADGIIRLAAAAVEFGEVWVVAPEHQRSAASHCITLRDSIEVKPWKFPVEGVRAFACSGFPADCVRVGCLGVMPCKPDVVLSGINYGYNVASDVQYSATVGAAVEAAFQGIRGIALSEHTKGGHGITDAFLHEILKEYIDVQLGQNQILNINFPGGMALDCRGIRRNVGTSRGCFFRDEYQVVGEQEDGTKLYLVNGIYTEDAEEGTDFRAVLDGYISVGIVNNVG